MEPLVTLNALNALYDELASNDAITNELNSVETSPDAVLSIAKKIILKTAKSDGERTVFHFASKPVGWGILRFLGAIFPFMKPEKYRLQENLQSLITLINKLTIPSTATQDDIQKLNRLKLIVNSIRDHYLVKHPELEATIDLVTRTFTIEIKAPVQKEPTLPKPPESVTVLSQVKRDIQKKPQPKEPEELAKKGRSEVESKERMAPEEAPLPKEIRAAKIPPPPPPPTGKMRLNKEEEVIKKIAKERQKLQSKGELLPEKIRSSLQWDELQKKLTSAVAEFEQLPKGDKRYDECHVTVNKLLSQAADLLEHNKAWLDYQMASNTWLQSNTKALTIPPDAHLPSDIAPVFVQRDVLQEFFNEFVDPMLAPDDVQKLQKEVTAFAVMLTQREKALLDAYKTEGHLASDAERRTTRRSDIAGEDEVEEPVEKTPTTVSSLHRLHSIEFQDLKQQALECLKVQVPTTLGELKVMTEQFSERALRQEVEFSKIYTKAEQLKNESKIKADSIRNQLHQIMTDTLSVNLKTIQERSKRISSLIEPSNRTRIPSEIVQALELLQQLVSAMQKELVIQRDQLLQASNVKIPPTSEELEKAFQKIVDDLRQKVDFLESPLSAMVEATAFIDQLPDTPKRALPAQIAQQLQESEKLLLEIYKADIIKAKATAFADKDYKTSYKIFPFLESEHQKAWDKAIAVMNTQIGAGKPVKLQELFNHCTEAIKKIDDFEKLVEDLSNQRSEAKIVENKCLEMDKRLKRLKASFSALTDMSLEEPLQLIFESIQDQFPDQDLFEDLDDFQIWVTAEAMVLADTFETKKIFNQETRKLSNTSHFLESKAISTLEWYVERIPLIKSVQSAQQELRETLKALRSQLPTENLQLIDKMLSKQAQLFQLPETYASLDELKDTLEVFSKEKLTEHIAMLKNITTWIHRPLQEAPKGPKVAAKPKDFIEELQARAKRPKMIDVPQLTAEFFKYEEKLDSTTLLACSEYLLGSRDSLAMIFDKFGEKVSEKVEESSAKPTETQKQLDQTLERMKLKEEKPPAPGEQAAPDEWEDS